MIVIDASALLEAVAFEPVNTALVERLLGADGLSAPHLVDVEVLSALRRLVAAGDMTAGSASDLKDRILGLSLRRYPHGGLTDRMWNLRHDITPYHASYVALSEVLEVPLVTADGHLARAAGHRATIELFERTE
ncbi:MAG: type II toxin-antitoxin system VapC family toxin [Actinobacteria bacterium]|nr:type II toxin-antitoxin system VapC family toxin [Actinomycetota bacterium]